MADESPKPTNPGPFDVRTVKNLVALMAQHDLSEIDLRDGMQRLRIRRGSQQTVVAATAPMPMVPLPAPAASVAPAAAAPPAAAKPARNLIEIKSESVGTFYSKPSPDAASFVSVGSKITPTTVVCLIEAMKLFSEIQAGVNGTIAEVCVENQAAIEFGQVLFRVEPG